MPVAVMAIHMGRNTWTFAVNRITAVAVAAMIQAAAGWSRDVAAFCSGGDLPQIVGLEAMSAAVSLRGKSCDERMYRAEATNSSSVCTLCWMSGITCSLLKSKATTILP